MERPLLSHHNTPLFITPPLTVQKLNVSYTSQNPAVMLEYDGGESVGPGMVPAEKDRYSEREKEIARSLVERNSTKRKKRDKGCLERDAD